MAWTTDQTVKRHGVNCPRQGLPVTLNSATAYTVTLNSERPIYPVTLNSFGRPELLSVRG